MGCCLTSWFSKKQTALAISIIEVEYISACKACQQALLMKQDLVDYDIKLNDIPVLRDNKGAIDLSKNPVLHLVSNIYKSDTTSSVMLSKKGTAQLFTANDMEIYRQRQTSHLSAINIKVDGLSSQRYSVEGEMDLRELVEKYLTP
ncbi:hypothetical protein Tco_0729025 [Tanacetum coccineum]|uniref:Uncharacterized protein n=1 Tax=Tanacetum coccineum TaxID=301880 RepID=A0ABQ4YMS0_9ASTR